MRTEKQKLTNLSVNLPKELLEKLNEVADFEERSKSYYIKKSLSAFLEQKYQDIMDYKNARKTLRDSEENSEDLVSMDEVFKDIE